MYKNLFLSTIIFSLFGFTSAVYGACTVDLDMGNKNILNVNELGVNSVAATTVAATTVAATTVDATTVNATNVAATKINGFNFPNTDGDSGAVLQTDGAGNLTLANVAKLYYSLYGQGYSTTVTTTTDLYNRRMFLPVPDIENKTTIRSNDLSFFDRPNQNETNLKKHGFVKIKKPGLYKITCVIPDFMNNSSYVLYKYDESTDIISEFSRLFNQDQDHYYETVTKIDLVDVPADGEYFTCGTYNPPNSTASASISSTFYKYLFLIEEL